MGKRLISQRRGRGTSTYSAHSHRWNIQIKHRAYDSLEKEGMLTYCAYCNCKIRQRRI